MSNLYFLFSANSSIDDFFWIERMENMTKNEQICDNTLITHNFWYETTENGVYVQLITSSLRYSVKLRYGTYIKHYIGDL